MKVTVIQPGMFTTVQDYGRFGYEAMGIPQSGFLDQEAAFKANQLIGNHPYEALLEITGTGPTLLFDGNGSLAISGADISPVLNESPIKNDTLTIIKSGDQLSFGKLKNGFRAYLAFKGKIQVPEVFGSKSTHVLSKFGGIDGRPLKKYDSFTIEKQTTSIRAITVTDKLQTNQNEHIILSKGPEWNWFTNKEIVSFCNTKFIVSNQSNRMGVRLEGNWIQKRQLDSIISSGNVVGLVQLPPSLQPIILLNDAGTVGGYPRIGICTRKSINQLVQVKPGTELRFCFK